MNYFTLFILRLKYYIDYHKRINQYKPFFERIGSFYGLLFPELVERERKRLAKKYKRKTGFEY